MLMSHRPGQSPSPRNGVNSNAQVVQIANTNGALGSAGSQSMDSSSRMKGEGGIHLGFQAAVSYLRSWQHVYVRASKSETRAILIKALFEEFNASHVFRTATNGGLVSFEITPRRPTNFSARIGEKRGRGESRPAETLVLDRVEGFVYDFAKALLNTWAHAAQGQEEGLASMQSVHRIQQNKRVRITCESNSQTGSKYCFTSDNIKRICRLNAARAIAARCVTLYSSATFSNICAQSAQLSCEELELEKLCFEIFWEGILHRDRKTLEEFLLQERIDFCQQLDAYVLGPGETLRTSQKGPFWQILRRSHHIDEDSDMPSMRELLGVKSDAQAPWMSEGEPIPLVTSIPPEDYAQDNCLFNFGSDMFLNTRKAHSKAINSPIPVHNSNPAESKGWNGRSHSPDNAADRTSAPGRPRRPLPFKSPLVCRSASIVKEGNSEHCKFPLDQERHQVQEYGNKCTSNRFMSGTRVTGVDDCKDSLSRYDDIALLLAMCRLLFGGSRGPADVPSGEVRVEHELTQSRRQLAILWMVMLERYGGWPGSSESALPSRLNRDECTTQVRRNYDGHASQNSVGTESLATTVSHETWLQSISSEAENCRHRSNNNAPERYRDFSSSSSSSQDSMSSSASSTPSSKLSSTWSASTWTSPVKSFGQEVQFCRAQKTLCNFTPGPSEDEVSLRWQRTLSKTLRWLRRYAITPAAKAFIRSATVELTPLADELDEACYRGVPRALGGA